MSTLKSQNDKLAVELTSEQNINYKHSLELAQQVLTSSQVNLNGLHNAYKCIYRYCSLMIV